MKKLFKEADIFDICLRAMLEDADEESRIWFTDTSRKIAKRVYERLKNENYH